MKTCTTSAGLIAATLLGALFTTAAVAADPMLSTGGYATEMHKMEMMKMLDADGNGQEQGWQSGRY
jgi:hypothetical protein